MHHTELNPGVILNVLLQILGELLVTFRGNHRQRIDLEAAQPLTLLIDAQTQATTNGLPTPTLSLAGREVANLEDVRVVPAFLQRRVRENELQR